MEHENETTDLTTLQTATAYIALAGVAAATAVSLYELGKLSVDIGKALVERRRTKKNQNKED